VTRAGDAVGDLTYFTARDDKPTAYVQQQVRSCDLYVGLIGLRYGSPVPDRPQMSYPELEFETATEAGMPRLVFMLDEDAALPIPRRDCSTATVICWSGSRHSGTVCARRGSRWARWPTRSN